MPVIREPGELDVTVTNNNIAKFWTRDEQKANLRENIKRRGPRLLEKTTEAKRASQNNCKNSKRGPHDEAQETRQH